MPNSWGVYYVVFLSALLALAIPAVLAMLSRVVSTEKRPPIPPSSLAVSKSAGVSKMGNRINSRYFLASNAAMLLVCLMLMLTPVIGNLGIKDGPDAGLTLIVVVFFSLLAGLGVLYAATKGDLSWIRRERGADE